MRANKLTTTQELTTVCNTLKGIKGFIANQQSLGVRVEMSCIAAARSVLQMPQVGITASNRGVAGLHKFVAKGFPPSLSAAAIVKTMATPFENSEWKPWRIIPFRSQMQGSTKTWYLKADEEPSLERIILQDGSKITITKELSFQEMFQQRRDDRILKNEEAKAQRRAEFSARNNDQPKPTSDPWKLYFDSKGKGRGRSQQPPRPAAAGSGASSSNDAAIAQLQTDLPTSVPGWINKKKNGYYGFYNGQESSRSHEHASYYCCRYSFRQYHQS